ncbi:hypothetical protein [Paraburkholderia sp. BR13444]|uniref:hypothetical protein n=1 Tax=Paraburkholderia TaxID=1822464 RepID=UPI0034CDBB64
MTIEIKALSTQDVFQKNDVFRLERNAFSENICFGAICWEISRVSSKDPLAEVLSFVTEHTLGRLAEYEFWLLIGNSAWQPDTRVVRYRKLFNALGVRGVDLSALDDRSEFVIEKDGKLKFFGSGRFDATQTSTIASAIKEEDCSYLIALPKHAELVFDILTGWSGDLNKDRSLIESVIGKRGIVFRRSGYFDDPEIGLLALGSPTVLRRL